MPASTPDPTRWLADLMATQQTFMQSLGAAVPPSRASDAAPDDPSKPFMPWQQAAQAMTDWQQQAMQQMTALWSTAVPTGADAPAPDWYNRRPFTCATLAAKRRCGFRTAGLTMWQK